MKYCQMFNHTAENDLRGLSAPHCKRKATWIWHDELGQKYVCDRCKTELLKYPYITEESFTPNA